MQPLRAPSTSAPASQLLVSLGWLIVASFLGLGVSADGINGVFFLFPTGGEIFYFQDVVNVTYITPFTDPQLYIFCGTNGGPPRYIRNGPVAAMSGSALVSINFTSSDTCWFNLRPNSSTDYGDNSLHFSILGARRVATTVGLATQLTTTATPTATPLPPATTPTAPSAPTTPTNGTADAVVAVPHGDGTNVLRQPAALDAGAIAAICVGTAIVATVVGGAAVAFYPRRKKSLGGGNSALLPYCLGGPVERAHVAYDRGGWSDEKPLAGAAQSGPGKWNRAWPESAKRRIYNARLARFAVAQMSVPDFHPAKDRSSGFASVDQESQGTTPTSSDEYRVELPWRGPSLERGDEQEMPASIRPPQQIMRHPAGLESQSQKFLLRDVCFLKVPARKSHPGSTSQSSISPRSTHG